MLIIHPLNWNLSQSVVYFVQGYFPHAQKGKICFFQLNAKFLARTCPVKDILTWGEEKVLSKEILHGNHYFWRIQFEEKIKLSNSISVALIVRKKLTVQIKLKSWHNITMSSLAQQQKRTAKKT